MSALRDTIEHLALNDGTIIPDGDYLDQIAEMQGWMTIAVAAVALGRSTNEIASRVYDYRKYGQHFASDRKLRPARRKRRDGGRQAAHILVPR